TAGRKSGGFAFVGRVAARQSLGSRSIGFNPRIVPQHHLRFARLDREFSVRVGSKRFVDVARGATKRLRQIGNQF
ncbi:MAG TPA: hypothetical protein VHD34_06330, partial [Xanthobacteraceae bacterium]|nr:hypothetical protein [Xanthobacteraceae bacterium]